MKRLPKILFLTVCLALAALAQQTEILTNATVVEMAKVGLSREVILKKINDSRNRFDVSTSALIELKKAGVSDEVIALMLEKAEAKPEAGTETTSGFSENAPVTETRRFDETPAMPTPLNAKEALLRARSVALVKSSLNPSRQGLEKALMKRKEWAKYNLTLVRYKEEADIYVEIGRVPLSWITHRYVFRIYDRRTGTIITAGETTSWGSLAENLAREITQKMDSVSGK
jgi:hypothetical protein